jgi:hypothetical protein
MNKPAFYRIKVQGHLDDNLASWFDGLTVSNLEDGDAVLSGQLPDQAALQGLTLLSVDSAPKGD